MEMKHSVLMMVRIVLGKSYRECLYNLILSRLIYKDAVARLSIFGCWMFLTNGGKFSPLAVLAGYYGVFAFMLLFNFLYNSERVTLEGHYWIGIAYNLLNYKCDLSFEFFSLTSTHPIVIVIELERASARTSFRILRNTYYSFSIYFYI